MLLLAWGLLSCVMAEDWQDGWQAGTSNQRFRLAADTDQPGCSPIRSNFDAVNTLVRRGTESIAFSDGDDFARFLGYLEWDFNEIETALDTCQDDLTTIVVPPGVVLLAEACGTGEESLFKPSVRTGTPIVNNTLIRVPFVLQVAFSTTQMSPECAPVIKLTNGSIVDSSSDQLRLVSRTPLGWINPDFLDFFSEDYASLLVAFRCDGFPTLNFCPTWNAPVDASSLCSLSSVQCLSLSATNTSFDPMDPDVQWVLGQPGTREGLQTTPRAVDMIMGQSTHIALLLADPNLEAYPKLLDLSELTRLVFVAVQYSPSGASIMLPSTTRGFSSVGTDMTISPLSPPLPDLALYAGPINTGEPLPELPGLATLQLSNPLIKFNSPWKPMPNYQLTCVSFYQALMDPPNVPPSCAFASTCDNSSFCFNQTDFTNLTSVSLLGYSTDLWDCGFGSKVHMPQLTNVYIEGSSMTNFSFSSSLVSLRLSYHPFLTQVELSSVSKLELLGNPQLSQVLATNSGTNTLASTLTTLDASFSAATFPSIYSLLTSNTSNSGSSSSSSNNALNSLKCIFCGLTSFPSLSSLSIPQLSFLNLSYNVIDVSLSNLLSSKFWPSMLEGLCVLDMTYNAVSGPLPDIDQLSRLFPSGACYGVQKQMILDSNLIESFFSPPFPYSSLNTSVNAEDYLLSFQIFSPNTSSTLFPSDVMLSIKNNRIKGKLPISFLAVVDLTSNDVWCDVSNSSVCQNTPVLYTSIGYGLTNVYDFLPFRTPFFPLAMSMRDTQSLSVTVFNPFSANNDTRFAMFLDNYVITENNDRTLTFNILRWSLDIALQSICQEPLQGGNTDLNSPYQFCGLPAQFLRLSSNVPFFSKKWLIINRCSRGRGFTRGYNDDQCNNCPVNTYSEFCAHCLLQPPNLLTVTVGETACGACPLSPKNQLRTSVTEQAAAVSLDQCVCPELSFGLPATRLSNGTMVSDCVPCTTATICTGKNITKPVVKPGYFYDGAEFLVCDPQAACEAGACATGYTGIPCSSCKLGFYRINRECNECLAAPQLLIVALVLFLFLGLLFLLRESKTNYSKMFTISITLGYVQIISVFATFPVPWPTTTHRMLNFLSFFNFNLDLASPECSVKTGYWVKWFMKLLLPLFAFVMLAIWFVLVKYIPWFQRKYLNFMVKTPRRAKASCLAHVLLGEDTKKLLKDKQMEQDELVMSDVSSTLVTFREKELEWEQQHLSQRFITVSITLATLGYTFLTKSSTQPFNCFRTVVKGVEQFYLRADPSVSCYDATWYQWQPLAILGIIVYAVGIPLLFSLILIRAWQKNVMHDTRFLAYFGGLIVPFREQFWFWELLQIARKLITVLIIDFQADNTDDHTFGQIGGVLIVMVLFFILQEFVRPYEFTWCNRLEFAWTGMSIIILVAAMIFSLKTALTIDQANAFAVFLIFALVCAFAVSLYTLLVEKRRAVIKVGLGASADKIANDHEVLENVLGPDLGDTMYRKMRSMSPQMRDKFVARVATLAPYGNTLAMTRLISPTFTNEEIYGNPEVFPSFTPPVSPKSKEVSLTNNKPPLTFVAPVSSMYEAYGGGMDPKPDSLYNVYASQPVISSFAPANEARFYDEDQPSSTPIVNMQPGGPTMYESESASTRNDVAHYEQDPSNGQAANIKLYQASSEFAQANIFPKGNNSVPDSASGTGSAGGSYSTILGPSMYTSYPAPINADQIDAQHEQPHRSIDPSIKPNFYSTVLGPSMYTSFPVAENQKVLILPKESTPVSTLYTAVSGPSMYTSYPTQEPSKE